MSSITLTRKSLMHARERDDPDLSLTCPADAENVAVIRRAVTGVARAVGVDEGLVNDVRTAVTEACGNVAVHAYPTDAPGAMVVTCAFEHPWLSFRVRDFGSGMQPQVDTEDGPRLRIGLSLISALADRFEIQSSSTGTEVSVGFDVTRERDGNGSGDGGVRSQVEDGVELIAAGPLGAEGVPPALVMLGVRSGFDVERLAELQRVGTTLAAAVRDGQIDRLGLRAPRLGQPSVAVDVDSGDASKAEELVGSMPPGTAKLVDREGRSVIRIELSRSG
jgi:anti-sigma regulatory factor (Ser/Thr protein kinase)